MVIGAPIGSIAATNAGTIPMLPPLAASSRDAAGPSGATALIAVATAVQSATGSSSVLSHETHATRGLSFSAHCARTVVFPEPGGATRVMTEESEAISRSISAVRMTIPARGRGGWNLGPSGLEESPARDFDPGRRPEGST